MAIIIVIPGIALYGLLGDSLTEPDMAFPYLVSTYLPVGVKGIILCGLFASLMSTVDSTFNSLATLWSTDIYANYIHRGASDRDKIRAGRKAILFALCTAILTGLILLDVKFNSPSSAFTHTLNNLRYYINCGIVVLICSAVMLIKPNKKAVLIAFIVSFPTNIFLHIFFPEINYFIRAFLVIITGFIIATVASRGRLYSFNSLFFPADKKIEKLGWALACSLLAIHVIFH